MMEIPTNLPNPIRRIIAIIPWLAGISFIIGTYLLYGFLTTKNNAIFWQIMGFYYVAVAIGINGGVLLASFIISHSLPEYRNILYRRVRILLLNIPVTILYLLIVFNR